MPNSKGLKKEKDAVNAVKSLRGRASTSGGQLGKCSQVTEVPQAQVYRPAVLRDCTSRVS